MLKRISNIGYLWPRLEETRWTGNPWRATSHCRHFYLFIGLFLNQVNVFPIQNKFDKYVKSCNCGKY